jgi:hypothetical protein
LRKSIISKAAVAGLVVAGASIAGAQSNGVTGLTGRIGVFLPTSRLARDISASWFAFGLDYKLQSSSVSAPTMGTLAYLGLSADFYSSGNNSALPIALTYNVRSGQLVWSAGIGIDFVRLGVNTSGLAGQVGVAYEIGNMPNPFLVQAKYFLSSKSDLNGFGLYAGIRF